MARRTFLEIGWFDTEWPKCHFSWFSHAEKGAVENFKFNMRYLENYLELNANFLVVLVLDN